MPLNDETVHKAFSKVREKIKSQKGLRKGYSELRKSIAQTVKSCWNDVKVTIYMDEVLDDPIIITSGKGNNKLLIIIDSDAGVSFTWTEETMAKAFWDGWGIGSEITKSILKAIAGFSSVAVQTLTSPVLAIMP